MLRGGGLCMHTKNMGCIPWGCHVGGACRRKLMSRLIIVEQRSVLAMRNGNYVQRGARGMAELGGS